MMSVCRPHPDKMSPVSFYPDGVYGCVYVGSDTDDMNRPKVLQIVPILSEYGCADTDTETWNSGLNALMF